jgi:hypothetical protein
MTEQPKQTDWLTAITIQVRGDEIRIGDRLRRRSWQPKYVTHTAITRTGKNVALTLRTAYGFADYEWQIKVKSSDIFTVVRQIEVTK